jgi:nitroreductase
MTREHTTLRARHGGSARASPATTAGGSEVNRASMVRIAPLGNRKERPMTDGDQTAGLLRNLYTTRALRRLKPDAVDEELLFQLIDAAIRAPSGQNRQDWRFVVVTDVAIKQLMQEAATTAWARYQPRYSERPDLMDALPRTKRLSLKATAYLAQHVGEAPAVIVVCGLHGRHSTPEGSIFPAVQNLLLTARAVGLGASIFQLALSPKVVAALGVPDDYQVHCAIPVGYPMDRPGPVRRRPVRQVAFHDRWDEPWPFAEQQPDDGWQDRWTEQA